VFEQQVLNVYEFQLFPDLTVKIIPFFQGVKSTTFSQFVDLEGNFGTLHMAVMDM
jgi:hypothetical protein